MSATSSYGAWAFGAAMVLLLAGCPGGQTDAGPDAGPDTGADGGDAGSDSGTGVPGPAGAPCLTSTDCSSGLCIDFLCREACGTCPADEVCLPITGIMDGAPTSEDVCQWYAPAPDLELGGVATPIGGSVPVTFDVPPGVTSFVIAAIDDDFYRVGYHTLIAPDGTALIDAADGLPEINKSLMLAGAGTVIVPNNDDPAGAIQVGTYSMTLGTFDHPDPAVEIDGDIERIAVTFVRDTEVGGVVDVRFSLAPATGLTAATAAGDPFMLNLLGRLNADLRDKAASKLGAVTYGPDLPAIHDSVGSVAEFNDVCAGFSAPSDRGTAINVMLVGSLATGTGRVGAIPLPPGIYGNPGTCIVVAAQSAGGAMTALTVMHEIGHALGLLHTTSDTTPPFGIYDNLSDTVECPLGTANLSSCPDYLNFMFVNAQFNLDTTHTPGQTRIMSTSPGLYEVRRPLACATTPDVFDATRFMFAGGNTEPLQDTDAGACGGEGAPDRSHLYRLVTPGLSALELRVTGFGFAPLVYVRRGACDDPSSEVACDSADADTEGVITVTDPEPGPYFIMVDGRDGDGGLFILDVNEIP